MIYCVVIFFYIRCFTPFYKHDIFRLFLNHRSDTILKDIQFFGLSFYLFLPTLTRLMSTLGALFIYLYTFDISYYIKCE